MLLPILAASLVICTPKDRVDSAIDDFARNLLTNYNTVGFAVGVIDNGKAYERYFGVVKRGSGQAPNGKTLFQLASVTKTFTAALLARAVVDGKVKLNDALGTYLPGVTLGPEKRQITLLELADHSSGIPRAPKVNGTSTSYEQMNEDLSVVKLRFPPGHGYLYSNFAFGVLAEALANVYRANHWADAVETEVMHPLGMEDTRVGERLTAEQKDRVAQAYDKSGAATDWMNPAFPAVNGAGGLYSDLDDMMKYLRYMIRSAHDQDRVVNLMLQTYNPMPKTGMNIGLAWQVNQMTNGGWFIEKEGSLRGSTSYVCFVKGGNVGLVLLANSRFAPVKACKQLMSRLVQLGTLPSGPEEEDGG
jgi:CubicO group peptidase (beta-lactamase class C family)